MNDKICIVQHLKILLVIGERFLNFTKYKDGQNELRGPEGKFLNLLINFLGVTAKFQTKEEVEDAFDPDISAGKFMVLSEYLLQYVYSTPYQMTSATFAVRKSIPLSTRFAFLYPFTLKTWLGIIFVLILVPALGIFIMKKRMSYLDLSLQMLGSLFRQGYQVENRSFTIRIYFLFWLFFTMVISFSYSAVFFSFMVSPMKNPPLTNFQQLSAAVTEGTLKCYVYDSYYTLYALRNSTEGYMKKLSTFFDEKYIYYYNDSSNVYENAIIQGHAILRDEYFLRMKYGVNSEVFISNDGIARNVITHYVFREGFCLRKRVNVFISRAWSAGLYQKILRDEQFKENRAEGWHPITVSVRPLSLHDISGVIIIFLVGIFLSFNVFIMELIVFNCMKLH